MIAITIHKFIHTIAMFIGYVLYAYGLPILLGGFMDGRGLEMPVMLGPIAILVLFRIWFFIWFRSEEIRFGQRLSFSIFMYYILWFWHLFLLFMSFVFSDGMDGMISPFG